MRNCKNFFFWWQAKTKFKLEKYLKFKLRQDNVSHPLTSTTLRGIRNSRKWKWSSAEEFSSTFCCCYDLWPLEKDNEKHISDTIFILMNANVAEEYLPEILNSWIHFFSSFCSTELLSIILHVVSCLIFLFVGFLTSRRGRTLPTRAQVSTCERKNITLNSQHLPHLRDEWQDNSR